VGKCNGIKNPVAIYPVTWSTSPDRKLDGITGILAICVTKKKEKKKGRGEIKLNNAIFFSRKAYMLQGFYLVSRRTPPREKNNDIASSALLTLSFSFHF
jgi:hypothetical protein